LNRASCGFYLLVYAKTNLYIHIWKGRYDKILETILLKIKSTSNNCLFLCHVAWHY